MTNAPLPMKLIHGNAIRQALRAIAPTRIAVAYVGIDWADYIDPAVLDDIVLSPTIGSNPAAIAQLAARLGWDKVHFLDNLHAKIYLGDGAAAVGSFNLTANGLGAAGLEEAGFVVSDPATLSDLDALVAGYRRQARHAYPTVAAKQQRLLALAAEWKRGVRHGVLRNDGTARQLSSYSSDAPPAACVCCVWGEMEHTDEVTSPGTVADSISFLEKDDVQPDSWILCWPAADDGSPDEAAAPYWLYVDEVVPHGARHPVYTKAAIERSKRTAMHEPFALTPDTVRALHAVLRSGRFPEFLANVEPWSLNDTVPRLPEFFDAMRAELGAGKPRAAAAPDENALRKTFAARIATAMDVALANKYVTHSIHGLLAGRHAVEVAKKLIRDGDRKPGLIKLARAGALHLSFESIMLEREFAPLFTRQEREAAAFNLRQVDPGYEAPAG